MVFFLFSFLVVLSTYGGDGWLAMAQRDRAGGSWPQLDLKVAANTEIYEFLKAFHF